MHSFAKNVIGLAAAAAFGAVLMVGTADLGRAQTPAGQPAAQAEKKPKDQGEYDLIAAFQKSLQAKDQQKVVADLTAWEQKYPESDYKYDRLLFFMQAYGNMQPPQHDKVVEYGSKLLQQDVKAALKEPTNVLQALFMVVNSVPAIPNPTPEQLALGEKAAKQLQAFAADPSSKPAALSDAQWTELKGQLNAAAQRTLDFVVFGAGAKLAQAGNHAGAEAEFRKSLEKYPENGLLAYQLGSTIYTQKQVEKFPEALWLIARSVALDPAKGGIADANTRNQIEGFLKKAYTNYHGSDDGLDQLKQQALASPLPPAGFKIKTATEVAVEKEEKFAAQYPKLALWMKIKGQLAAAEGEQYFEGQLKNAAVPSLKGVVVSGECRAKEVLVGVPDPEQPNATLNPEVTLKLDTALKGKPVAGTEIEWEGVPTGFSKDPFMLTMDTEQAKITGMKVETCTVAPAKKAPKAPAGKKKK